MKPVLVIAVLITVGFTSCRKIARGRKYFADRQYYTDSTGGSGLYFLRKLIDDKVYDWESKSYSIKIPDSFRSHQLAWGSTYFTGLKKNKTNSELFYLVLDYDSTISRIIIDKNGNTDFTDDSLVLIRAKEWITVEIRNQRNPRGKIEIRMRLSQHLPDSLYGWLFKGMTHERHDGISSGLAVMDKNRYYRKVKLPGGNIITLYDLTVNGFFNDKRDKIIAGDIQSNIRIRYNAARTKEVKNGIELPFGNKTYKLIEVDKYGNSVELVDLNKNSDTSERLSAFNYINEKKQNCRFEPNTKKELGVLYIWGSWCVGCVVQAPEFIKLMEQHSGIASYFTFNCGETVEKMNHYLEKKKYPFNFWRLDYQNVAKLNADGFPHYIVIDKQGRILLRTLSVSDLKVFLDKFPGSAHS